VGGVEEDFDVASIDGGLEQAPSGEFGRLRVGLSVNQLATMGGVLG